MRGIKALGFKGANFTIPHKIAVIPHLDRLSPAAEQIAASGHHQVGQRRLQFI